MIAVLLGRRSVVERSRAMSQLGVDNTISSPCWQGESNTGDSALAGAGIECQSSAAIASGVAGTQFSLSSRDVNGLPRQWFAGEYRRKAPSRHPVWKRTMDVVGSTVLLAILLPVLFAIALYIKCVSRGPVLFRQFRFGVGGLPFKVWKFRTIEVSDASAHHRSHLNELIGARSAFGEMRRRTGSDPGWWIAATVRHR